jgi:hypothetical protein
MKVLLQEYLFRAALKEHNIECDVKIDHKNGWNFINDEKFGIKYPVSYIDQIKKLSGNKIYDYCFIGSLTDNKGRKEILEKYKDLNSIICHSSNGRDPNKKYQFDTEYYQALCNSRFGLCPGHPAMPKHPTRWTYRFIESAFCKAIPVMFEETIYGESFIRDIFYVWDKDLPEKSFESYKDKIEENYTNAIKYWTFQQDEIEKINLIIK